MAGVVIVVWGVMCGLSFTMSSAPGLSILSSTLSRVEDVCSSSLGSSCGWAMSNLCVLNNLVKNFRFSFNQRKKKNSGKLITQCACG